MALMDQINKQLTSLPSEKQNEVLDFILFLQQRATDSPKSKPRSLKKHPAFGAWQQRQIDAITYQRDIRAEWDSE